MGILNTVAVLQAIILLALVRFASHTGAVDDAPCLQEFKRTVKDPKNYLGSWNFNNVSQGGICSFVGVLCWNAQESKVLQLKLDGAGLSGTFPSGLDKCVSLTGLNLSGNAFSGGIPSNLCSQVPFLTDLDLSDSGFSGSIPDNLVNCTYLNKLHLGRNKLTGPIPRSLGLLTRLKDLDLSSNFLNGTIPTTLGRFPAAAFQNNPGLSGPPLKPSCIWGLRK